jgi:hypothetical protein
MIRLFPDWNRLSLIGTSKVISLTIFVPFIGYLILFNNELVNYFVLSSELVGTPDTTSGLGNETILRLYFLYYGLIFLGLSSIIFSFLCPDVIKDHKTEFGYINDELKISTTERVAPIAREVKENLSPKSDGVKYLDSFTSSFNNAHDIAFKQFNTGLAKNIDFQGVMNEQKSIEAKAYTNILKLNWDYHNTSKIASRVLLSILYTVGFILVLIPSANVFWKVLVLNFST